MLRLHHHADVVVLLSSDDMIMYNCYVSQLLCHNEPM